MKSVGVHTRSGLSGALKVFGFLRAGFSRSGVFGLCGTAFWRLINFVAKIQINREATRAQYKAGFKFWEVN